MKIPFYLKIVLLLIIVSLPPAWAWLEYQRFLTSEIVLQDQPQLFTVQPGDNLTRISQRLEQQGLSNTPSIYLDIYGRIQKNAHLIKAGEYEITPGMTLPELLQKFIAGQVTQYAITIVEGMSAQQVLTRIQSHPKIQVSEALSDWPNIMKTLSGEDIHPEGWFMPETYHFTAGTTDMTFLRRAYQNMQTYLNTAWETRADNLPYKTPYEALIMASIIEKETGVAKERDLVAGVFVKRLQIGMRLQTDPTVIYGMGEQYDGNIRRRDLQTDTPYNTYTRHGLPPTPIAMPSKASIDAALHPNITNYLYFVASSTGDGHVFSTNLQDHNRAVRQYWSSRQ